MLQKTWAEISLNNLIHNYRLIEGLCGKSKIMPVIKADAYGHGAVPLARLYEELGASYFGVATVDEAVQLRHANIKTPILNLGYTPAPGAAELLEYDITQTVYDLEQARLFSEAALSLGRVLKVHIKIDTGMTRIGIYCRADTKESSAHTVRAICALKGLEAEGIFTHFAHADEPDNPEPTKAQLELFLELLDVLKRDGITFPLRHCANSGAILYHPRTHLDMVRPGIILYGERPGQAPAGVDLRPALELFSTVAHVKKVGRGERISYGGRYVTPKESVIATVPIGYADGLSRVLSGKIHMLTERGVPLPQIGSICMDQCMVDASAAPSIKTGDIITVYGGERGGAMSACDIAKVWGTINYEVLCQISKRVARIYLSGQKPEGAVTYPL